MKESVEVKKVIKEGIKLRIHPSYGYAGIQKGNIRVISIYEPKDAVDIKGFREIRDAEIEQVRLMITTPMLEEEILWLDEINTCDWVGYAYTHGQETEIQYLPLSVFIDHITTC